MPKQLSQSVSSFEQIIQRKTTQSTRDIIAYALIAASAIFWVAGFIYSNEHNLQARQTCMSFYTVMSITSYTYATAIKSPWNITRSTGLFKLFMRNIIFLVHALVCSTVQFYIPLNLFHVLGCTGPIFTFITNYLINGIKVTKQQIIGVFFTFIGLVLAINGRFLYSMINSSYQFESGFQNYRTTSATVQVIVCLLYLCWTFAWSLALIFTKIPEFNSAEMMFTTGLMGTICYGFSFNFYQPSNHIWIYAQSLLWVGLPLTIASYMFTFGFKLTSNAGKASTVLVVSNAIIGYMMSYFRYGQSLNIFVFIGTLIIFLSVFVVLKSKNVENKNTNSKQSHLTESASKYSDF